jgi:hypothetical protein
MSWATWDQRDTRTSRAKRNRLRKKSRYATSGRTISSSSLQHLGSERPCLSATCTSPMSPMYALVGLQPGVRCCLFSHRDVRLLIAGHPYPRMPARNTDPSPLSLNPDEGHEFHEQVLYGPDAHWLQPPQQSGPSGWAETAQCGLLHGGVVQVHDRALSFTRHGWLRG